MARRYYTKGVRCTNCSYAWKVFSSQIKLPLDQQECPECRTYGHLFHNGMLTGDDIDVGALITEMEEKMNKFTEQVNEMMQPVMLETLKLKKRIEKIEQNQSPAAAQGVAAQRAVNLN